MKKTSLILIGIVILSGLFLYSDNIQAATFKAIYLTIDVADSEMFEFYGCGLNEVMFKPSISSYEGFHCPIFLTEEDDGFSNNDHLIIWVHKGETIAREGLYNLDDLYDRRCPDRTSPGCEVDLDWFGDSYEEAGTVALRPFGPITSKCGNCSLAVSNTEYRPKNDIYCNESGYWEEIASTPPPPVTCTDTDGGKVWGTYGECKEDGETKCQDFCLGGILMECYCENNQCEQWGHTCVSDEHCLNGECVPKEEHICDDTDGGQVWDERGSCYADTYWKGTDECLAGSTTKLKEWYCDGTTCGYVIHDCAPYGCQDGKCTTKIPTCEDTDETASGQTKVFDKYGECYENGVLKGQDYCIDGTFLEEWYCEGAKCTHITQKCSPSVCQSGKCTGVANCMLSKCEGLETGICMCGTKQIEYQYCCADSNKGYNTQALCLANPACAPPVCQCSDGTSCGECKVGSPPKYCNEYKQLVNDCRGPDGLPATLDDCGCPVGQICQLDGSCAGTACTCSDGTFCNQCKSGSPPLYCDETTKTLINECGICGCPSNQTCQPDGSCKTGGVPTNCGNGVINTDEDCDNSASPPFRSGDTCQSLGFTGGTLSCKSDCTFNTFGCTGGGGGTGEGILKIENPLGEGTQFKDIVGRLIDFIFKIAIVLAPLMIVVGAFLFVTSAGDLQKVSRAKSLMIWTVVGFIIVLLAKGLLAMLESILGVAG